MERIANLITIGPNEFIQGQKYHRSEDGQIVWKETTLNGPGIIKVEQESDGQILFQMGETHIFQGPSIEAIIFQR